MATKKNDTKTPGRQIAKKTSGAKSVSKGSQTAAKTRATPKPKKSEMSPQAPVQMAESPIIPSHRIVSVKVKISNTDKPAFNLAQYAKLMRLDKPIGILLLLWPTLWSLWIAAKGIPRWDLLVIFTLGVVVMRSAGCVINDIADRNIDGKVARTQGRPLATGKVSVGGAWVLFVILCLVAFGLVLLTDPLTIKLSVGGLVLAATYPFMKRHTHLPQVVLGAAFAWSIPMAFAAQTGEITPQAWLIYFTVVLWTVVYDTFYAMVDRDDDLKIGVKSTAILFGEQDRIITGLLQFMTLYAFVLIGERFELGAYYKSSLLIVLALFGYQQWLIRFHERSACFKAFLNNNWVGAVVFAGIVADFALKQPRVL